MKKVSFEMGIGDLDNLLDILQNYVVKYKYEPHTNPDLSKAEIDWMVKHGNYVEKEILNKIIQGIKK